MDSVYEELKALKNEIQIMKNRVDKIYLTFPILNYKNESVEDLLKSERFLMEDIKNKLAEKEIILKSCNIMNKDQAKEMLLETEAWKDAGNDVIQEIAFKTSQTTQSFIDSNSIDLTLLE